MLLSLFFAASLAAADGGVPASSDAPAELIDDVRLLYRVVTCQPDALPPQPADAGAKLEEVLSNYCKGQVHRFDTYRQWAAKAKPFLHPLEPAKLPAEAVYPFGGGDLMTGLTVFPEAHVITTLSLELAGDPRRLATMIKAGDAKALKQSLAAIAEASASTLVSNDSLSKNLSKTQRGDLPGQLSMHLMGLALADYEPVSARFFRVEPDGSLHYFSQKDVADLEKTLAVKLRATWKAPDFSPAFANVELQFVPKGKPDAPRRIHRHIGADLSNDGLTKSAPGVLKHLQAKGRVAAMTKAASYLMWNDSFTTIRDYLVSNAEFMVSDSTGVPPRWWKKAGCTVQTYGTFQKSFLGTWEGYQEELRKEFESAKKLPMRFGYPDGSPEKRSHLIIANCTRRATDAGVK